MEEVKLVDFKFCVIADYLKPNIALGFIFKASKYEELTDFKVWELLGVWYKKTEETKTLEQLDKIVKLKLRTNKRYKNMNPRMNDLFTYYHTLLVRNGLEWLLKQTQRSSFNIFSSF